MLTEQLKEWMYVYGSWGWKWVRGGLVDGKENLMPPSAKSRVSPWRSSMDPTQSQSQNQESRFSHRGKGNGKSFLTRTNMTPKVLILVKKRKPVSGPLTGATACFQGRERIFKHQSRKHLTKWWAEYNYLLSPPTPLQAGKWLPGSSVSVRWPWTSSWRGPACFNTVYGEAFPEHLTNDAKCLGTAGWRGEAAHQFLICFSIWVALSFGHVNSTCLPVDE